MSIAVLLSFTVDNLFTPTLSTLNDDADVANESWLTVTFDTDLDSGSGEAMSEQDIES